MSVRDIRIEVVSGLLEELCITATPEQVAQLADDFAQHMEMEREQDSYQFVGVKPTECEKCKRLARDIEKLESDVRAYQDSVRLRRGLDASDPVYVDNGRVTYEYKR